MTKKIELSDEEWKQKLTSEQYRVLRKKGTEAPFTGALDANKNEGMYACAGCDAHLFASGTKFDSGSGWPSFWEPIDPGAIELHQDVSHGTARIEVVCAACGGHLGHVFSDGPSDKTGDRFCINSTSLGFSQDEETK